MSLLSTTVDPASKREPRDSQIRRVILLCPDLHEIGGIGMVSRLAFRALDSFSKLSGCRGEVWSYGASKTEASGDFDGWQICYAQGRKATAALWGLKASLGDARHTLVIVMHLHLAPLALPLVQRGACLAVFLHGIEAWTSLRGIRRSALRRASVLVANSQYTVQQFLEANPVFANASLRVCSLGLPDARSATSSPSTPKPFALIVGRLSSSERYKGHDALLEIWREMSKIALSANLVIVGDGDDRQRLEERARELTVANAVTFLGKVSNERLASLYSDCSFFVMPSSKEGFGLVFLEAMRAGKACIAGQGAAEEIVVDGETGFIVSNHDGKELLAAMSRLFRDTELSTSMGQAGRARYLTHFTESHFAQRLLNALDLQPINGTQ